MKAANRNNLHYRGYVGNIEFSEEDAVFHGKVVRIKPLISFEGESVKTITEDFQAAVDEYLEHCEANGIEAEKPFKGSFFVRVGSELHRQAALEALGRGVSLDALVEDALMQVAGRK